MLADRVRRPFHDGQANARHDIDEYNILAGTRMPPACKAQRTAAKTAPASATMRIELCSTSGLIILRVPLCMTGTRKIAFRNGTQGGMESQHHAK
jgi:hypothetical protein